MANPTTNYGFVLPTSSDLVTDLPADFDVALQGVDTRLKALQPGTTAGDLAYSSATANTNTRLAIGTAGQVLTVNSGATAPEWATPAGGGKVLQVVQSLYSTTTTIASTSRADSGLTATITPSSASSKILVIIAQATTVVRSSDAVKGSVYIMRGATDIISSDQAPGFTFSGSTYAEARVVWNYSYLDSPATTSAVTYKTQGKVNTTANSGTIYFQLQAADGPSTMILMEIGA
jgi:hypothetical protein